MLSGQRYLGHEPDDISTACLRDAVCYSAVASMTEGQCQAMFNGNKSAAMTRYRAASDTSLEAAQLLTTSDITVLQAFVLYLIARRTEASSRAIWTLVAVAVRISKALSLHLGKEETFFSQQIRQRLWYTICVLDLQASFEQGSEPLIELDPKSSALPKNINDSEFDVDSTDEVQDRDGLTDMTFALVTYSAQLSGRLLNFYGKEADTLDWEDREKHVSRFEQNALNLLKFCDPESSPYAWFAFHGTQSLVATMRLSALRPLHRVGGRPTPRNHLPADLLDVALKVLDKVHLIRTDPRGEGFRWYVVIQWHALAIAITECYVCADVGILRMAWPVVEAAFEYHMTVTETYRQGIFRKPLERLMVQARKRVGPLLRGQNHQPQPPSQSNLELSWGSVGGEQSGCPSNTRSSSSIAATELDSPNQTCLPTNQLQPHMPLTPLDLNCGGASPCFAFDNPIAGPSAIPSWFAPHMPFNPNSETSNTMDVSSNNTGDAAWRTWEEFVSGLSFDEFPHMAA
ncbi:hypothetical protein F5B20DRAFT_542680 [Whalleya microplaca]|nr:hypothetical protein F5B20DRAFT_542680 [Whalleya microplaca]